MSATTIGVDVGGTKIAAGVVAADGTIVARHQLPSEAQDPQATVAAILKVVTELRATAPATAAVGLGAAALIDFSRGMILGAPNLAWKHLPIADLIHQRAGVPVVVDNDANVAALGEATYGAGRGGGDQIMLTIGTGVGGGIIINSAIYRGAHGAGAELGHMVVDPHGPLCGCGSHGCLESVSSGTAIGRMAREQIGDAGDTIVLELAREVNAITGAIVGQAALRGDAFALSIVRTAGWWLGVGLASFVNIFDPERIVVGGGVTQGLGELLLEPARASMRDFVLLPSLRPEVPVLPASLGNDAGLIGAAVLARSAI